VKKLNIKHCFETVLIKGYEFLFEKIKFPILAFFVLLASIFQNGIWYGPVTKQLTQISQSLPYINHGIIESKSHWLYHSILGPLLAYVLHQNSDYIIYSIFHFVVFIVIFSLLLFVIKFRISDKVARIFLFYFYLSALPNVIFTWLGLPDIFTILLSVGFVLVKEVNGKFNRILLLLIGFLMGVSHLEQGFVSILILAVLEILLNFNRFQIKNLSAYFYGSAGILFGRLFISSYFWIIQFEMSTNRVSYLSDRGLSNYIDSITSHPFLLAFSFFQVMWIALLYWVINNPKAKTMRSFILTFSLALSIVFFTLDITRVFSILIFPVILQLLARNSEHINHWEKRYNYLIVFLIALGILVPRLLIWDGRIIWFPTTISIYRLWSSIL
jgi:hypothetical protein